MKSQKYDVLLLAAGFLVCWQLLYWLDGSDVISSPSDTILRAIALLRTQSFWKDATSTGIAFVYACVIGILGGIALGLALGLNRFVGDVADPILGTVYSIPKITLYPIILLIFGLSLTAKVAFGVIHGIFPVAIFTMNAVRNVAPVHRRTARVLRLSSLATIVTVLAPAAIPEILSGIRVGIAVTLLGILIAELFASSSGIGFALIRATDLHNVVDIFALTLLLFLFAVAINTLLHIGERRVHHGVNLSGRQL
jgi:NitT/TauT family transport system permease protein